MRIGIDIGGTKMVTLARCGNRDVTEQLGTGPRTTPKQIENAIDRFLRNLDERNVSFGVAVPGLVDEHGVIIACDVLPLLVGWSPRKAFRHHGVVVAINDVEAALIAEAPYLPAHGTQIVIMVGTGIAAAIRVDGDSLRRTAPWAGELGSVPVGPCESDVLDLRASGAAILRRAGVDANQLRELIDNGDPAVIEVIRDAGSFLGLGIAVIVNLLNPNRVVFGGGTLTWPGYFEAALATAEKRSLPELWRACSIERTRMGENIVAIGAAVAGERAASGHDRLTKPVS